MRTTVSLSVLSLAIIPSVALAQGENPNIERDPAALDLIKAVPGGLTSDRVSERAIATSYTARAYEESVRVAALRVDAAWANFLPRASGLGRYTRLSELTPPNLAGSGSLVASSAPIGTINPMPTFAIGFTFPVILNNWTFQGTLAVPISDYFLRINQNYTAATLSRDAARYDLAAARATSGANARVSYYSWLRARGGLAVAIQTLGEVKAHLTDAQNIFTVGRASKADVLRAETAVANAELTIERSKNLVDLFEKQVHVAIHDDPEVALVPGESLETPLASFQGNLQALIQEARSARMEVKSIEANAEATTKLASVQRAGMYPTLGGVANVTLANPNPRVFPAADYFFTTWDASIALTWSPNDVLISGKNAAALDAQAAQILAQKEALRDGITLEVTQSFQALKEADFAIDTGQRILASAREAYRVARELFVNGTGTSTTLADAEGELNQARLGILNAEVEARIARIRLDHAVGRDAKLAP
jgi:outer membrane protein TolC